MKSLKQWITWQEVPKPEGGKPAKVPFCFNVHRNIDAQDPANWLTYEEAKALSDNVGIVLTGDDPYFCVDLDNALLDGEWSDHSHRILSWFPGAYVEVSHSGKGIHIFGKAFTPVPAHRKKIKFGNDEVELYTSDRFIAFSEQGTSGDYNTDLTKNLHEFIRVVMPPDEPTVTGGSERYGGYLTPDPEWLGPSDDAELIKRMLASKPSPESALTGKATINDLWTANEKVLAESYPDGSGGYDRSSADAALFAHLAWWTGKDGPRMEDLARSTALHRSKWDEHRNYLSGTKYTIHNACDRCKGVYRDPKRVSELAAENSDDPNYKKGSQFLPVTAQVSYFKGCVYILDQHKIFTPKDGAIRGGVINYERFNVKYGGVTFALTHDGKSTTKKAFDAFTNSQVYKFSKVSTSCFRPEHKPGEIIKINDESCVNTYIPAVINFGTGPVDKFLFLMRALFPKKQDYNIALHYMAAIVQYPGIKFRWCLIIQGVEGNGKTLLMQCVAYAVGEKYTHIPQVNDMGNKFNAWMAEKLFIMVEELFTEDKREIMEALKPLITNDRIAAQPKGVDTIMIDNKANFMMGTNHKNALKITIRNRRYSIHFCPQQEEEHLTRDGLTESFFKEFTDDLKNGGYQNVAGYLKRLPMPDHLNPATSCIRAPKTTSTLEAIECTQGTVHHEVRYAIVNKLYGFRGGWVSSHALSELLESKDIAKFSPNRNRKTLMKEIGYILAPWLKDGRASYKLLQEENSKPRLYILESQIYGDPLTTNDYVEAQKD